MYVESERRRWQNPEDILLSIGLRSGQTFLDIGCGYGFFALPAARRVGKAGHVYGLDINADAIARVKEAARREGLSNVEAWIGTAEEMTLCEGCADFVFFGIVLHDFDDVGKVLANAKTMLKHSRRLVDLDWAKKPMLVGPPLYIRLSEEEATKRIEAAGFTIEATRNAGPYSYLIIAKQ